MANIPVVAAGHDNIGPAISDLLSAIANIKGPTILFELLIAGSKEMIPFLLVFLKMETRTRITTIKIGYHDIRFPIAIQISNSYISGIFARIQVSM